MSKNLWILVLIVLAVALAAYAYDQHLRAGGAALLTSNGIAPAAPPPAMAAIYSGSRIPVGVSTTYVDRPRVVSGFGSPDLLLLS